jgi:cytochrome c oxidase assembly protein subunit 15
MAERRLARLATVTALAVWALVVVGGIVRVTGSGLGCPDWPRCFGALVPAATLAPDQHLPAWLEMGHRYLASIVSLLVVVTAAVAWRGRAVGAPWRMALVSVAMIVVQIVLCAVTVWAKNAPITVIAHLAAALALLAATTLTALLCRPPQLPVRLGGRAWALIGLTAALALVGSVVQNSGGGWACPDFPLCHGQLWPAELGTPALWHMVHRLLALLTGVALVAVAVPAWRAGRSAARNWVAAAVGLYLAQVAVGIAQVMLVMPAALRGLHLALAAAFWAATLGLVVRASQAAFAVAPAVDSGARRDGVRPAPLMKSS